MTTMDLYAAPRAAAPACDREDNGPAGSSDLTLACGVGSGDTAALGELYRRYNRRVYSLVPAHGG